MSKLTMKDYEAYLNECRISEVEALSFIKWKNQYEILDPTEDIDVDDAYDFYVDEFEADEFDDNDTAYSDQTELQFTKFNSSYYSTF